MLKTSIPLAGIILIAWACSATTPPPEVSVMLTRLYPLDPLVAWLWLLLDNKEVNKIPKLEPSA